MGCSDANKQSPVEENILAGGAQGMVNSTAEVVSQAIGNTNDESAEFIQQVRAEFERVEVEFRQMKPEERPQIPRVRLNRKINRTVKVLNEKSMPERTEGYTNLTQLVKLVYYGAVTVVRINGEKINDRRVDTRKNKQNGDGKPIWQKRLEGRIEGTRKQLGQLT